MSENRINVQGHPVMATTLQTLQELILDPKEVNEKMFEQLSALEGALKQVQCLAHWVHLIDVLERQDACVLLEKDDLTILVGRVHQLTVEHIGFAPKGDVQNSHSAKYIQARQTVLQHLVPLMQYDGYGAGLFSTLGQQALSDVSRWADTKTLRNTLSEEQEVYHFVNAQGVKNTFRQVDPNLYVRYEQQCLGQVAKEPKKAQSPRIRV